MADARLPVERLRAYLRDLKPEARALLMAELERVRLRGEEMPAAELILQELRSTVREKGEKPPRVGNPQRLFFAPLEPFLTEDRPDRKHQGRIARTSLDPIWRWISEDLMPIEFKAYADQVSRLLLGNDVDKAEQLARAIQDRALQRIQETLALVETNPAARRRLADQVGTPQAFDDLAEIVGVLKTRDALALLGARLPPRIKNLAGEQLDEVKALLDTPVARHLDIFLYGVLLVMSRLDTPWQLIRLAVRAAESDTAAQIVATPFAVAVSIVLDDIERLVSLLLRDLKGGRRATVASLLRDIHDGVCALRTELDLSGDSPWARQFAALRRQVSKLLETEIASAPDRIRHLLQLQSTEETKVKSSLDAGEVADAEALVELVSICRNYASELAIKDVTLRVHSELQNYLDTVMTPLLDGLRNAQPAERKFRQSQIDAAVRFSAKMFGAKYASLFAKAAEVAARGEQKAAKA